MTTTIRIAKDIHAPAADVWDIVSNFTTLPNWFPGVTTFECTGKSEGSIRKVTLGNRDAFTEKLITLAPDHYTFAFAIVGGLEKISGNDVIVTVNVNALRKDACNIEWLASVGADEPESEEKLAADLEQLYDKALNHLKRGLEAFVD